MSRLVQHVLPISDLRPHEERASCWCIPDAVSVGEAMLYIHNSMDRREV
jgi:hypothetical protein